MKKITANVQAQSKFIDYNYDFSRLTAITYPNFPGNNVAYTYGAPGAANNTAGRITTITSQMGTEQRQYGKLGETVYEKKTVSIFTNPTPPVFETSFLFETFGRLLRITYPDGEVVTNTYDSGGNLAHVEGLKQVQSQGQNHRYVYLNSLLYDKFEQRSLMTLGNGVKTAYTYDAQTRRLNNLNSVRQGNTIFQNLNYGYDKVGNILSLANAVAIPPANTFGGPTSYAFAYDDLYRLTHAQGTYQFAPSKTRSHTLDLAYDTIHNITSKNQLDQLLQPGQSTQNQSKTTYNYPYAYNPSGASSVRPHAPNHIGLRTFTYDANGNQTGWTHDNNGTRRTITWDDENRVQSIADGGSTESFKYDDAGNRAIKRGAQSETVYVNQFYAQRPGSNASKHIYAGTTRIASKLVQANPGNNGQPFEKNIFFYHPDHLGSTGYVTDVNAKVYEHVEYFAFGETWVLENSNQQSVPFLFTGKEFDEETGLYYFGARYYDPRTSVWQSADPAIDKFLPVKVRMDDELPGLGGIYNSFNLGLYTYGHQNPLRYTDPDGKFTIVEAVAVVAILGLGTAIIAQHILGGDKKRSPTGSDPLLSQGSGSDSANRGAVLPRLSPVDQATTPSGPEDPNGDSGTPTDQSRPTDRYKEHLTRRDLDAARRELNREIVGINPKTGKPFDHLREVRSAQQGLQNRIEQINRKLGSPSARLTDAQRADLIRELRDASRLLDYSKQFVPPEP